MSECSTSPNDVSKRLAELIERERKCDQTELKLRERETSLKEREAKLDKLEKDITKRQAWVEGGITNLRISAAYLHLKSHIVMQEHIFTFV